MSCAYLTKLGNRDRTHRQLIPLSKKLMTRYYKYSLVKQLSSPPEGRELGYFLSTRSHNIMPRSMDYRTQRATLSTVRVV